ncbi:MAG TPA: glycosyltransferase family 61 protein [Pseudoalteromonas sp.]|uniref:Glycosyltransferase 61 catalytic domain-containing protein n=1 Tax=marine sediment metagenome TaxID=412755 RepID=A0A0F9S231_9ZZZZ|nr:glycosyltransferase 61 family protein [Pseudoalteromonas sp.]HDY92156.1 glycosyltransferase family 61 protein [Pseudoalteromonas sp.]HDZ32375.1 glycosyltransferase family 61 protein [Pseudoalteromonas sp.]
MKVQNYPLFSNKYSNALIISTKVDPIKKQFEAGVYDDNGKLVKEALRQDSDYLEKEHFTQVDLQQLNKAHENSVDRLDGNYIYLGFYAEHYGHFLLETLSRLWAIKNPNQYDGFIFNNFVIPRKVDKLTKIASFFFNSLGLDSTKIIILKRNTFVDNLIVPNAQCYILNKAHPKYIDIFERLRCNVSAQNCSQLKLYLSRSKLQKRKRKVLNEHKIEEAFFQRGFQVVYMESLSINEQLSLLANANVIAGLEGSALHNCLFMKPGSKVINICGLRQPSRVKPNQVMCNELNSIDSMFIPFSGQVINEAKLIVRFDIPHLKRCLKILLFK